MTPNRLGVSGKVYYVLVVTSGILAIAWAITDLWHHPTITLGWFFLAALSLISGWAAVRLPLTHSILSFSETFLFAVALLYGPAAAVATVCLEATVIGLSPKTTPHKALFTLSANSLAMLSGALVFFSLADVRPATTWQIDVQLSVLWLPMGLFVATYFGVSSWLVAVAVALEKRVSALKFWLSSFAWLLPNYVAGAFAAMVLVAYAPHADPKYLLLVLPLVALLYYSYVSSIGRAEDANRHLAELNLLYLSTIETLATAIDAKDQVTHGHIRRVQQLAVALATSLGIEDEKLIKAIEAASLLHDMGKLAVPDYILNKPGPLTPAEFERMKAHASVGADILSSIKFPYPVVPIVRHHHEHWNGSGYPDGLAERDIPIGARVLSVVDCFDALTSDRPYRPRLSDEAAMEIIRERSGTMYDPVIVAKFDQLREKFPVEGAVARTREGPLAAITDAAASAQEGAAQTRLHEISASSEEMLALYEIARAVSGPFSFDDAAEIVARHLRRLIPATFCVFYSYEADTDDLLAAHASGDTARVFTGLRIAMGQRLTGWVGANRQTILNSDPVLDLGEAARMARPPLKSALSTALISEGNLVGVVTLYSSSRNAFSEDHVRIIEAVARQVAGTLRNALHFDERKKSSLRDDLTGLPSVERLRNITEGLGTSGDSEAAGGSIVLVDVDDLHDINHRVGRPAGDEVLARVAEVIRQCIEGGELLFRNTGDEFVIFMARTDRLQAGDRALSIREAVWNAQIASPLSTKRVCVSVGVASVPSDGTTVEVLLAAAARRLATSARPRAFSDPGSVH